jgi:DNA-binding response OmpR family regulator
MRVLIVEDDLELAGAIESAFGRRGVASDRAATVEDATLMADAMQYAAVILDLGLPDGEGLDFLARLRGRLNPIPVLITTARGDVRDRIQGLEAGADDYLAKPFDFDELFARLQAVLRRKGSFQGSRIDFGNLRFDTTSRELVIDDKSVTLSSREIELIDLLLRRSGRVVSRQLVEDQLFGMSDALNSNAVEVYIHRLRRKLDHAGADVMIETVRGVGYLLRSAD